MKRQLISFLFCSAVALAAAADAPQIKSDACLSCHNGTSAPKMESSHPYAIDYTATIMRSKSKFRPAQLPSGFGSTIAADLLVSGNLECVTCHVPHEQDAENPFRLRSRDVVKLCTACHVMR